MDMRRNSLTWKRPPFHLRQQLAGSGGGEHLGAAGGISLSLVDDLAAFSSEDVAQPVRQHAVGEGDDDHIAQEGGIHGGAVGATALAPGVADDGIRTYAVLDIGDGGLIETLAEKAHEILERSRHRFR